MLFAQHRAFELMDSLVRHGDAGSIPGVYSGNIGARASTLAAIGNYNPNAMVAEDRELTWLVRSARGSSDVMTTLPDMKVTIDPKETVYIHLQQLGLADKMVKLANNEVYKDMPWTDMATKATEKYTQDQLETHLSNMYANMYPTLKATHPERFDAYFGRTMNTLGIHYELQDGAVKILDMKELPVNMNAIIDIESFAKTAAADVVATTPKAPENPREELTVLAGVPDEALTKAGELSEEATPESITSGISSVETSTPISVASVEQQQSVDSVESTLPVIDTPTSTSPQPVQQPVSPVPQAETLASNIPTPETSSSAEASADKPVYEKMPQGVEERIDKTLHSTTETSASVSLTPGELMDYIRSSVDIAGTRITGGKIQIDGNTVKLNDMKADIRFNKAHIGEGNFSATLLTDPQKGLVVDHKTLSMKLPFMIKLVGGAGALRKQLDNFNGLVLDHLNGRIDQNWQADRLDIVGEKLEVTFAKKPSSA